MTALPPLAAIRVFEAAARHRNFTRAAEELGMTQAAVSYQIKLLESRLGAPLFLRLARHVELTDAGRRLAPQVSEAFDALRHAFAGVGTDTGRVLSISAANTFASNWLAPRLGEFQLARPDLAVRVEASARLVDFAREEVDVGIRSGRGVWPGVRAHRLFAFNFAPLCAPRLLEGAGVEKPADLLRLPILNPSDRWWKIWFDLMGVEADVACRPGIRTDSQQLDGAAALAGQGVAILTPALWRRELEAGLLVQPFAPVGSEGDDALWLVYPEIKRGLPKIREFRDWVLAKLAEDERRSRVGAFELSAGPPR